MKNRFTQICMLCLFSVAGMRAQNIIQSNDTSLCNPTPINFTATIDSLFQSVPSIEVDDQHSGIINLGFTFNFFGNNYTQCVLSSNGYITFNLGAANSYSPWMFNVGIPSATLPQNCVMGPYQDTYPQIPNPPDIIGYQTYGTAPNRRFVFAMCEVAMFSCTNLYHTGQIILFEGSNTIEVHITNKPLCATWNNGNAIIGVQNIGGTIGVAAPGRNAPGQWTATNEAWRFTPNGGTYTVTSIPFNPAPFGGGTLVWYNANGVQIGTGGSIVVNPTSSTYYVCTTTGCQGFATDTVWVNLGTVGIDTTNNNLFNVSTSWQHASCSGAANGMIEAHSNDTVQYVYQWANASNVIFQTDTGLADTIFNLSPGTYHITVTSPNGCTGTHTYYITQGSVSVNATASNASCASASDGQAIATATGVQPIQYYWVNNGTLALVDSTTGGNTDTLFTTPGSYSVIAIDANGCADTATTTIGFNSITAGFTYSPPTLCPGGTVSFTNNSTGANISYSWDFGDGSPPDNSQHPSHVYTSSGSFQVVLTITGNAGCTEQATTAITVSPTGGTDFTMNPAAVCLGQSIQFSDASINSPVTWAWDFGDGTGTSTTQNPSYTYTTPGTYVVSLSVTTVAGCATNVATHNVVVHENPVAGFTFTNVCEGVPMQFVDTSYIPPTAIPTYDWNFGDGTSSSQMNPAHAYPQFGTYNVTLTVNVSTACSHSVTQAVQVYAIPTADFTTQNVCFNDPAIFTNTSSIPQGVINQYSWDFGDGFGSSSLASPGYQYLSPGNYNVQLSIVSDNGCQASVSHPIEVYVLPQFAATSSPACYDSSNGSVQVLPFSGQSPYQIVWSTLSPTTFLIEGVPAGLYDFTITDFNGCTATGNVSVWQPPGPLELLMPDTMNILFGSEVQIPLQYNYYMEPSFVWQQPAYNLSCTHCQNPVAAPQIKWQYHVVATDSNGCMNEDWITIYVLKDHTVYIPNIFSPNGDGVNDIFQIQYSGVEIGFFELKIFNRIGEKVFQSNNAKTGWDGSYKGEPAVQGVYAYLLRITFTDGDTYDYQGGVTLWK